MVAYRQARNKPSLVSFYFEQLRTVGDLRALISRQFQLRVEEAELWITPPPDRFVEVSCSKLW